LPGGVVCGVVVLGVASFVGASAEGLWLVGLWRPWDGGDLLRDVGGISCSEDAVGCRIGLPLGIKV
jgi:hypothetical protein